MKKKGISLIVLVITIIIIIILAGAVILNLNNNNPVDNARRSNVHQTRDSLRSGINLYAAKVILSENGLYNASTLLLGKNVNKVDASIIVNYASKLTGVVRGKQIDLWQLDYQLVNEKVGIKLEHLDSNSYWCIDEFENPYLVYNSKSNVAGFLKGEDGEILPSLSDFVIYIEGAQFVSSSEQTAVSSLKNSITSTVTSYITSKKAELGSSLTTKNIILGEGVASGSEIASSTDPYNVTINGNETKLYKIDSAKYEAKAGKTLENTYESGDWCIDENGNIYLVFENQSSIPASLSNASMSSYVTYNGATVTINNNSQSEEDDLTYTVSYNANGGTGTMNSQEAEEVTILASAFTAPSGKRFKNWNSQANGSGDTYNQGDKVTKNLTLYAQWENAVFSEFSVGDTVTINNNGTSENFFVIQNSSETDSEVKVVAYYSINLTTLTQGNANGTKFSETPYWYDSNAGAVLEKYKTDDGLNVDAGNILESEGKYALYYAQEYGKKIGGRGRLFTSSEIIGLNNNTIFNGNGSYEHYWVANFSERDSNWMHITWGGALSFYLTDSVQYDYGGGSVRPVVEISKDLVTKVQ